jgi:hypothetical protein
MAVNRVDSPTTTVEAAAMLGEIHRNLNEYRDSQRWGLVKAGEQFSLATMVTLWFTLALLVVALIRSAPTTAIVASAAFYLVGAIAGLFKRLHAESDTDSTVDDFEFASARIWQTPVLSGLAGIGGVMLIAMVPYLSPQLTLAVADSAQRAQFGSIPPALHDVFSLELNPHYLLVAAVFGLTPEILLGRLQHLAEQYKGNLQSTQATQR